jgi:hypothetical protein
MAASFNKYQNWVNYLSGNVASNSIAWKASAGDAIKVALSNTSPTNTLDKYSTTNITEIAAGNGYTTGGATCTCGDKSYATGTVSYPLTVGSPTWTSGTADMATFQYVIFYDNTPTDKPVIGWYDYGSALVLHGANADTFTVSLTGGNLFSLS